MTILSTEDLAHAATASRLTAEPISWLTTVAGSGQPHSGKAGEADAGRARQPG